MLLASMLHAARTHAAAVDGALTNAGRVHTSTATVAALPEMEETSVRTSAPMVPRYCCRRHAPPPAAAAREKAADRQVLVNPKDLRIDTYRSKGSVRAS
jgi:hypothetical protein